MPKFYNRRSYMGRSATKNKSGVAEFASQAEANAGTEENLIISPKVLDEAVDNLIKDASTTEKGKIRIATDAEAIAGTDTELAMTPHTVGLIAIAGAPLASEILAGIAELATQTETNTGTDDAKIVTPLKLKTNLASPPAIGGTTPAAGTFTTLVADSTSSITLDADATSHFQVSGAGVDLELISLAGRVIIDGEEAASTAVEIKSVSGGVSIASGLKLNITGSQNAADAVEIKSIMGGIDITASGSAGEDIDISNTGGSVNLTTSENVADSIVLNTTTGGIDIVAGGAVAGFDIDITNTSASINLTAGENAADAIKMTATNGGIDITAGGGAGEDIDITNSGSINLVSTEDAAKAIYLHANGGTSETIKIHADQGTGVASIEILSDVGGLTLTSGLGSADAININASDAGGGIDIDSGTAGIIVDTTGAISLDSQAASNFTVTGAFDLTLSSSAGSVIISGEEAVDDAIQITSTAGGLDVNVTLQLGLVSSKAAGDAIVINTSNAAGGIDIDSGTGGIAIDSTGAISLDSAGASNFTVTGAFDLTLSSSAGSVNISGGEDAADAVVISAGAGGIDISATGEAGQDIDIVNTGGSVNISGTEAIADAVTIGAASGGVDITCGGGAGFDIDINNTGGSVNITASENAANAIVISSTAGGIDITGAGGAGEDIDITNSGSINITSSENVSDAVVITASGAASGVSIDAGTSGVTFGTGIVVAVTSKATADSPYAVLGTDYFIGTNSTAGAMTITLPAAPTTGRKLIISDTAGQAAIGGAITIDGNGKNITFAGASAATQSLNTAYESVILIYNGSTWTGLDVV